MDKTDHYRKTNYQINTFNLKFYTLYFLSTFPLYICPIAYPAYRSLIGKYSMDDWFLLFPLGYKQTITFYAMQQFYLYLFSVVGQRLPFELDTEFKHFPFTLIELVFCNSSMIIILEVISFFVNISWFITALYSDLQSTFATLLESNKSEVQLEQYLCKAMAFHVKVKK